jgi:hypothetical protein
MDHVQGTFAKGREGSTKKIKTLDYNSNPKTTYVKASFCKILALPEEGKGV